MGRIIRIRIAKSAVHRIKDCERRPRQKRGAASQFFSAPEDENDQRSHHTEHSSAGADRIDVDALRAVIDAGMKQCGGEFEIPIDFGLNFGRVDTRVTKMDIDKFFDQTLPAVAKQVQ